MLDRLHREKLPLTYEERRRVSARLAQRGLDALDMGDDCLAADCFAAANRMIAEFGTVAGRKH